MIIRFCNPSSSSQCVLVFKSWLKSYIINHVSTINQSIKYHDIINQNSVSWKKCLIGRCTLLTQCVWPIYKILINTLVMKNLQNTLEKYRFQFKIILQSRWYVEGRSPKKYLSPYCKASVSKEIASKTLTRRVFEMQCSENVTLYDNVTSTLSNTHWGSSYFY